MFETAPSQTVVGKTKPIKVAVTGQIKTNTEYSVYFLANKTDVTDPLNGSLTSEKGGADFAADNSFIMFNQHDASRDAAASKVTFKDEISLKLNQPKQARLSWIV